MVVPRGRPDPREVWEVKVLDAGEQTSLESCCGRRGGGRREAYVSQSVALSKKRKGQLETAVCSASIVQCHLSTSAVPSRAKSQSLPSKISHPGERGGETMGP